MSTKPDESTLRRAVAAVLDTKNLEEASSKAGVSTATLKRWSKFPEYRRIMSEARSEILQQTVNRILQAQSASVEMLETLRDESKSEIIKLKAATSILRAYVDIMDIAELDQRLTELERKLVEHEQTNSKNA